MFHRHSSVLTEKNFRSYEAVCACLVPLRTQSVHQAPSSCSCTHLTIEGHFGGHQDLPCLQLFWDLELWLPMTSKALHDCVITLCRGWGSTCHPYPTCCNPVSQTDQTPPVPGKSLLSCNMFLHVLAPHSDPLSHVCQSLQGSSPALGKVLRWPIWLLLSYELLAGRCWFVACQKILHVE